MGQSHHRSFDIEVYAPGCDNWLEVSSVSWFSDYQARRGDIRFSTAGREGHHGRQHAERLGAGRAAVWAAIVENYRQADGSVAVPEVLQPYMRGLTVIAPMPSTCRLADPLEARPQQRFEYETAGLDVADVAADPMAQWQRWFDEAVAAGCTEPNAFVLSTIDAEGWPQARYLLLRAADERGFTFFTNYESAKSRQLTESGQVASMLFTWLQLHRQVRVLGEVERVPDAESDEYFASRPAGLADRGVGVAAVAADPRSGLAGAAGGADGGDVRRRARAAARRSGAVGCCGRRLRVLAGPPQPPPRPPALHAPADAGRATTAPQVASGSPAVGATRCVHPNAGPRPGRGGGDRPSISARCGARGPGPPSPQIGLLPPRVAVDLHAVAAGRFTGSVHRGPGCAEVGPRVSGGGVRRCDVVGMRSPPTAGVQRPGGRTVE